MRVLMRQFGLLCILFLLTMLSVLAFGQLSFAEIKVSQNVNVVADEQYLQKQLEVHSAGGNPLNKKDIFVGYINYQTVAETTTQRVTATGKCGYSYSTNGGKTWKNDLLPAPQGVQASTVLKCGDPAVAWDTTGHVYYFALSELTTGTTVMSIARLTDLENGTFKLDFHKLIDSGNSSSGPGQFLDKGYLIFQPDTTPFNPSAPAGTPGSLTAPGTVFACYSNFDGAVNKKVLCSVSRNSGTTWSKPNQGKYNGTINSNNGVAAAPAPNGGIYVFWRAFASNENGYYFVTVDRNGTATTPVQVVGPTGFYPYDAPTGSNIARSNAFPTVASDGGGNIAVFFQAYSNANGFMASPESGGEPRIFGTYSTSNGLSWSTPLAIEPGPHWHQFLPVATWAGGVLSVTFLDARNDRCLDQDGKLGYPLECGFGRALNQVTDENGVLRYLPTGLDRRFDVRVLQGLFGAPGSNTVNWVLPSTQVTRYETLASTGEIVPRNANCPTLTFQDPSNPNKTRTLSTCAAVNLPFLKVAANGNSSFTGDYMALAPDTWFYRNRGPGPAYRLTGPGDPTTTVAFWADFRNVAFPEVNGIPNINGDWTQFANACPASVQNCPCQNPKSRDVNVRFADITTQGLSASVKGKSQLPESGIPPEFTVTVWNFTGNDLNVRVKIVDLAPPYITVPVEDWSYVQTLSQPAQPTPPDDDDSLDVKILKSSSFTKAVFYRWRSSTNSTPTTPVPVTVDQIGALGCKETDPTCLFSGHLTTSATYNISSSGLKVTEAHAVTLSSPFVATFGSFLSQPSNSEIQGSEIQGSEIQGSEIQGSEIQGSEIQGSLVADKLVLSSATGGGTLATAVTTFSTVANGQELLSAGWKFHMLLYVTQLNMNVKQCTLVQTPTDIVLAQFSILNPDSSTTLNFQVSNSEIQGSEIQGSEIQGSEIQGSPLAEQVTNGTFSVDSGEQVKIALRAFKPKSSSLSLMMADSATAAASNPPTFDPCPSSSLKCTNISEGLFGVRQPGTSQEPQVVSIVDNTPPTVKLTLPPPDDPDGSYDGPITVGISASDVFSTVTRIDCTDNGKTIPVTIVTGLNTSKATGSIYVSGKGTHTIACTAKDSRGNDGAAINSSNTATVTINTNRK